VGERQLFGILTDHTSPLLAHTSSLPFAQIIERYEREIQPQKARSTRHIEQHLLAYWKER
jgi:hypothetical protein